MSTRFLYLLGLMAICLLLLISFYLEYFDHIMPCPLCILQRIMFGLLAILFLIGSLTPHSFLGRFAIPVTAILTASLGLFFAGRQIWLQHFPPPSQTCDASLQYMLQIMPLHQVVQKIFAGSAECTQSGFSFLSLNMAEWSSLWFIAFLGLSLYLVVKSYK